MAWTRWLLALGLLLAEYVFLTVTYTTDALRLRGGWWGELALIDPLAAIAFSIGAAVLLIWVSEPHATPSGETELLLHRHRLAPPLFLHALVFTLFLTASARVLGDSFASSDAPALWLIAWATLAAALLTTAIAIALPVRAMVPFLYRARRPLLIGACVGLLAWSLGRLTSQLWGVLGRFTFDGVAIVLRLADQNLVARPEQMEIGIDDFVVSIAPSCAGYEGIGMVLVFLAAVLWLERDELRFPHAWILLLIGVAAVLVANIIRIASLILVGRWLSPQIAGGAFHSKAGWILYCATALGIAVFARRWKFVRRGPAAAVQDVWNPAAIYLMPLLVLLATTLVSSLVADGFDYLYPLRPITVVAVLWAYRDSLPLRALRPSWEAAGLGVFVFVLWLALEPPASPEHIAAWPAHFDAMPAPTRTVWLVFRVIGSVIAVPIAEEMAFRGYLLRRLVAADFTRVSYRAFNWQSLLLSSLAFGALHQRWIAGTIAGVCFALAQLRRGKLEDAIAAHAIANALIAADVLLFGAWNLWG